MDQAPVVYGKYQLLELLARGGMAEVFKAKSHGVEGFEKILVIKRILPELSENPRFVDMFINEAKIAVTLSHANIVQVFDLGRAEGSYFIAMEYVAGYDLATVLRRSRKFNVPLPTELAVYILSEVAKGLDYAHRRRDGQMRSLNIVHRDVSPQNVLLSYEGEVKLTDFGIAKARTTVEDSTEIGVLKGKYAYMAPEQATGGDIDGRTDLFALGTVLYEAISGKNPFLRTSTYDTLKLVRDGISTPLGEVAKDVPDELSAIVSRAMSVEPGDRHPNAGRLYEELIQFLYSSGRRVGAHDLSAYLDELRVASEQRQTMPDDEGLRAAFDDGSRSSRVRRGADATPVEIPSQRSQSRRPGSTGSGVARPQAEWRDVTALSLSAAPDDPLSMSQVRVLLRRFGGVLVEQSVGVEETGDGRWFVALFGVKDPDGHDTEAAARCAWRVTKLTDKGGGAETTVQLAVHSGRVLVDLAGQLIRDHRYDRLIDEARGVAGKGGYGEVVVTRSAERPIRALFELRAETDELSGNFSILTERKQTETVGKFVGRREELRRMGEALAMANAGRQRVLGVVGEAGTGKSRLMLETRRRLRLGGHDVGMYVARISRQSRDVPLAAVQEMLRVILGVEEFDSEAVIREKVARLRELGLQPAEQRAVETALGLQVEGREGEAGVPMLQAAFSRITTKLAEDRLTVFAFDNVEAMDDESLALLYRMLRDARTARVAVILSYRPGVVHAWVDLPDYTEIQLGPLTDDDLARLTGALLKADEVPMELLREVTAKSGGNPLYVEEYLKALLDAGAVEVRDGQVTFRPEVAEVQVPKTLRGIVTARLARLGPVERHLLQIASVAVARITPALLSRVAGEAEEQVVRALDLLERRGVVARQGATEYRFAHDMFGEVLRDGLTIEALREMHGAVAESLEALYPDHVGDLAERLAQHYREAGNRPKAVDALVRAADRLETEHALEGAVTNLAKAIDLLGQSPTPDRDRMLSLYRRIGDLSFRSRRLEDGAEKMSAALELAESLGRDEYIARFSMMRGRLLANANRATEGKHWLDRARKVARALGNGELLRDVALATAEAHTKVGEYVKAVGLLQEALDISRELGDARAQIQCLSPLALAYSGTGDRGQALDALAEARRLASQHPDRYTECELFKVESILHDFAGDHQGCIDAGLRGLELAKEYGFVYEASVNAHNVGEAYLKLGDYKRAFSNIRYSYEVAREHGMIRLQYVNLKVLGFIDVTRFGSPEGRDRVMEAVKYAEEGGWVWDLIQAKYMLALVDFMQGDLDQARQLFREVLRLSAESGNRWHEADAERALKAMDAGEPVPLPG